MKTEVQNHIENRLNVYRTLFTQAAERVEALKPGEKIPATTLAKELAVEHEMTDQQAYLVLKVLWAEYPGVKLKGGAKGGIFKLDADGKDVNAPVSTDNGDTAV